MLLTSYHNNDHVIFYRMFYSAKKKGRFTSNRAFACDVMAAMLVYLDKRILNIFF